MGTYSISERENYLLRLSSVIWSSVIWDASDGGRLNLPEITAEIIIYGASFGYPVVKRPVNVF